jgi:hypothetical protein
VKKSGPVDCGGIGAAARIGSGELVPEFLSPSLFIKAPRSMLARGVERGGDLILGESGVAAGDEGLGEVVSDGTDDVRRSHLDSIPPLGLVFTFIASVGSSTFFSITLHPIGTWSSEFRTVVCARIAASHADEPFELRKCANGLVRVSGRFRVSFKVLATSFEVWVLAKWIGASVGGSVGTSRDTR